MPYRRGPWDAEEDRILVEAVDTQGASNWVKISNILGTRSPKQCRERYHQNLKPNLNLNPISAEEGQEIERMVQEMGKRWAEIARRLGNRSDNAVKNWWNGGMNRRKRRDNRRVDMSTTPTQQHQQQPPPHGSRENHLQHVATSMPQSTHGLNAAMYATDFGMRPSYMPQHHPYQNAQSSYGGVPGQMPLPHFQQQQHMLRRGDGALPSPSAQSFGSRGDSLDGPPSLTSDHSGSVMTASSYQYPTYAPAPHHMPSSYEPRDSQMRSTLHQPTAPYQNFQMRHPYPIVPQQGKQYDLAAARAPPQPYTYGYLSQPQQYSPGYPVATYSHTPAGHGRQTGPVLRLDEVPSGSPDMGSDVSLEQPTTPLPPPLARDAHGLQHSHPLHHGYTKAAPDALAYDADDRVKIEGPMSPAHGGVPM